jgi:hypothetical protein
MYSVEVALQSENLSSHMAAMRIWLDRQGVESSKFTCRDSGQGMVVCIEFKMAHDAEEFAEHFSRGSDGLPAR